MNLLEKAKNKLLASFRAQVENLMQATYKAYTELPPHLSFEDYALKVKEILEENKQ